MSKKLLSAILTIAMVASLFTMAFASPVSAEEPATLIAAAPRANKVNEIKDLIVKVLTQLVPVADYPYGEIGGVEKTIKEAAANYGILTYKDGKYYLPSGAEFSQTAKDKVVNDKFFGEGGKIQLFLDLAKVNEKLDNYILPVEADTLTPIEDEAARIVKFAIYAYVFGTDADSADFDATFNDGRVQIYDLAIEALNGYIAACKKQIRGGMDKPSAYADDFAKDYYFALIFKDAYNSSYGINPFFFLNKVKDYDYAPIDGVDYSDYFGTAKYFTDMDVYAEQLNRLGLNTAVRWYTFDEIRANSEWADLLNKFELALRASLLDEGAGVLYADYSQKVWPAFYNLCKAIVGTIETYKVNGDQSATFDATKEGKAYTKLLAVRDIYVLFIKDIENNMYTDEFIKALAVDGITAERIYGFLGDAPSALAVKAIDADKVNALADEMLGYMAQLVPVLGQTVLASDVDAAKATIAEAETLLAVYPKNIKLAKLVEQLYVLENAVRNMKAMLPGEDGMAKVTIKAGERRYTQFITGAVDGNGIWVPAYKYYKVAEWKDSTAKYFSAAGVVNDDITISFAPTYFMYLIFKMRLDKALGDVKATVNELANAITGTYNKGESVVKVSKGDLEAALKKYGFLVGRPNNVPDVGYAAFLGLSGIPEEILEDENQDTRDHGFTFHDGAFRTVFGAAAADPIPMKLVRDPENDKTELCCHKHHSHGTRCYETKKAWKWVPDIDFEGYDNVFDAATRNYIVFFNAYQDVLNTFANSDIEYEIVTTVDYWPTDSYELDGTVEIFKSATSADKSNYAALIAALKAAAKYLTSDMTVVINYIRYKADCIRDLFFKDRFDINTQLIVEASKSELDFDNADGKYPTNPANYPNGYYNNLVAKYNALQKILARYTYVLKDNSYNLVLTEALEVNILAAYEDLVAAAKWMTTDLGDAIIDQFEDAVDEAMTKHYHVPGEDYEAVYKKLETSGVTLKDTFEALSLKQPYKYYAFTMLSVAIKNKDASNIYAANAGCGCLTRPVDKYDENFLTAYEAAMAEIGSMTKGGYSNEIKALAAQLYALAQAVYADLNVYPVGYTVRKDGDQIHCDMPVWYALKLLASLQTYKADNAAESVAALNATKAAILTPYINQAAAIDKANYNTDAFADVWNAFVAAYNTALAIANDWKGDNAYIYSNADINAAAEALKNALEALDGIKKCDANVIADLKAAVSDAKKELAWINDAFDVSALKADVEAADAIIADEAKLTDAINEEAAALLAKLVADYEAAAAKVEFRSARQLYNYAANRYVEVMMAEGAPAAEDYTKDSYKAFEAAYAAAKEAGLNGGNTYKELKAAKDALEAAIKNLEIFVYVGSFTYKTAVSTYNYAVSYLESLKAEDYTAESYKALVDAIEALKTQIDNKANDVFLQNAIIDFNVALAQLEAPAPVVVAPVEEVKTLDD